MGSEIYLDYNATTPVDPRVREAMQPYFETVFGNPSAAHAPGREAKAALERARETLAGLLGSSDKDEIIFVSSGTEADNLALLGTALAYQERGRHIITSAVEHPAVLESCAALEKQGFSVTVLPVDGEGMLDLEELRRTIRPDTILVSLMHANNETGILFPLDQVGVLLKERGILFHTDAVQSFGKVPLDVRRVCLDLVSLSAHKIYGPKGVAALYARRGVRLHPLLRGGRTGTGSPGGDRECAGDRRPGGGGADHGPRNAARGGADPSAPGPTGGGSVGPDRGDTDERAQESSPAPHVESGLRWHRGPDAGRGARPGGGRGLGRIGVSRGERAALPCVAGDAAQPGAARREHSRLLRTAHP